MAGGFLQTRTRVTSRGATPRRSRRALGSSPPKLSSLQRTPR
jgi:hypothetical protein